MKTIYNEVGKFVISDEVLSDIETAVQGVKILAEKKNWRPCIEIIIPDEDNSAIIKVKYDSNEISADLGCYGEYGWDSYTRDVRSLPDLHFEPYFVYLIADPYSYLPDLSQIEKEHWKVLAEKLAREAKDYSYDKRSLKEFSRAKNYMERLISTAEGFCKNEKTLEDLVAVLESKKHVI